MLPDELARVQPSARVFAITGTDERRDEFTHFKMQMREVFAVSASDLRDLLTASNFIEDGNRERLQMCVIGLHVFARAVLVVGMQDNDDLAPARSAFLRVNHAA